MRVESEQSMHDGAIHKLPTSSDQMLTVKEVSTRLKVSSEQVRTLIRQGQISAVNVGAGKKRPLYRITHEALGDFMKPGQKTDPQIHIKKSRPLPPAPDLFPHLK